jgi:hypothetical protein
MRKLPLFLTALLLFFVYSCKKSSSSHSNNTNSNAWLSSVTSWSSPTSIVDSFTYDSAYRVASYMQIEYDTSSGTPNAYTWSAVFSLPAGSSAPPSSYTNNLTGTNELHQLTYDAQGRIIKDTSLGSSGWVIYFSYPANEIAITALYEGSIANSIVDTLFLSNGNIGSAHVYGPNNAGTADSLEQSIKYGFSGISNPAYHSAITSSVGPLLYILAISGFGGNYDAISQKAYNSLSGVGDGLPTGVTINFTLGQDAQGRLSSQSVNFGGTEAIISYRYY